MERFGRYRVTGTLGTGAMGEVFAAVDESLGREVAVKTLRGGRTGLAARMLDERFRLEARAIASLSHPNVVQVFDLDATADPPYLVMERVAGPSLRERLRTGPLDERGLRVLGIQIARALAAAHAAGIVHRDVKPANILAAGENAWKLADFGVAHVPDSSLTLTGQFVGSPAYAPPEALVRGQCDPCGDVFGLGASLYEAAAGRWPRADATTSGLLAPVPPLATLVPDLSPELAAAIDRAVAVEPGDRPGAAAFAELLAAAAPSARMSAAVPAAEPLAAADISASRRSRGLPSAGTSGALAISEVGPVAPHLLVAARPASAPPALGTGTDPGGPIHDSIAYQATHAPVPEKRRLRWQPWAIGAAVAAVMVVVALLAGRSSSTPASIAPPPPSPAVDDPPTKADDKPTTPDAITVNNPTLRDRRAAKDWNKVLDQLDKRHFGEARKKLGEFERKWGEYPETKSLRDQLDALPEDLREDDEHEEHEREHGPPGGPGKKGKHGHD